MRTLRELQNEAEAMGYMICTREMVEDTFRESRRLNNEIQMLHAELRKVRGDRWYHNWFFRKWINRYWDDFA